MRISVGALAIAGSLLLGTAANANIVTNGGFETGDFTGWTQTGDSASDGVTCPGPSSVVAEGNCSAFFGAVGDIGGITQSLTTVAGETYKITFALEAFGFSVSSFTGSFDGTQFISLTDPNTGGVYHTFSFFETATGTSTDLAFDFRDDPLFMYLDAVSVTPAPEPMTLWVFGIGLAGVAAVRRRKKVMA